MICSINVPTYTSVITVVYLCLYGIVIFVGHRRYYCLYAPVFFFIHYNKRIVKGHDKNGVY